MDEQKHRKKRKENLKLKQTETTESRLTGSTIRLTGLTSHHLALFLLLLSPGEEKVGSGKMAVGVIWDRLLAQSHAANGRHVSFWSKHVERDSKCAANLTHSAETFLVVGTGATHVN
jgi:hypothetical protein